MAVGDVVAYEILSGCSGGLGILLTGTDTAGAAIVHTGTTAGTDMKKIFLYAVNNSESLSLATTVMFGGTATVNNAIVKTIPRKDGLYMVCNGLPIQSGNVVTAFAATGGQVTLYGDVWAVSSS